MGIYVDKILKFSTLSAVTCMHVMSWRINSVFSLVYSKEDLCEGGLFC